MKQFYLPLVLFFSLLISQFSWSQVKVGDNPTQISPFTVFELESTDKGLSTVISTSLNDRFRTIPF